MNDPRLLLMPAFLMDYPFAESLYPAALDVIAYLQLGANGDSVGW